MRSEASEIRYGLGSEMALSSMLLIAGSLSFVRTSRCAIVSQNPESDSVMRGKQKKKNRVRVGQGLLAFLIRVCLIFYGNKFSE